MIPHQFDLYYSYHLLPLKNMRSFSSSVSKVFQGNLHFTFHHPYHLNNSPAGVLQLALPREFAQPLAEPIGYLWAAKSAWRLGTMGLVELITFPV